MQQILLFCFACYGVQSRLILPTDEKVTVELKEGTAASQPFLIIMDDEMIADNPQYATHSALVIDQEKASVRQVIDVPRDNAITLSVTKYSIVRYQQIGKPPTHFIPTADLKMICGGVRQPDYCSMAPSLVPVTLMLISGETPVSIIVDAMIKEDNPQLETREGESPQSIDVSLGSTQTLNLELYSRMQFRVTPDEAVHAIFVTSPGLVVCRSDEFPPTCSYE